VWLSNGYAIGEYSLGNNRIEFYTTKLSLITNGNDVMTLLNSGNVGIGITNPSQKLTIAGNNSIMFTGVSAQNMPSYVGTDSSDNFYVYSAGQGSGKSSYFGPSNGTHLRTIANFLDLYVGNGAPILGLRLNSTGNILINTTTDAGFRLDVNGTARVQSDLTVSTGKIFFQTSSFGIDCNTSTGVFDIKNNLGSLQSTRISFSGGTYFNIYQPASSSTGITSGIINTISTPINYTWSSGTVQSNLFVLNPNINNTGTYSGTFRGFYYNPTLTSMTGTTHFAIHTTSGRIRFEGLPTSPTGLSAGDLYNDGGIIKIV